MCKSWPLAIVCECVARRGENVVNPLWDMKTVFRVNAQRICELLDFKIRSMCSVKSALGLRKAIGLRI